MYNETMLSIHRPPKITKFLKKYLPLILFATIGGSIFSTEYQYTKSGFKYVVHKHYESSYQHAWCKEHNGIEEYENKDFTRVDCLTKTHAVEFDFANKWAESIGQALHYQLMTKKRAKVVLILEDPKKEKVYFKRVQKLAKKHNFDVEYVTLESLNLKDGKCPYMDCKCNK